MAQVEQSSGDGKKKKGAQKKMSIHTVIGRRQKEKRRPEKDVYPCGLYPHGGHEHAFDYVLHALYHDD